MAGREKKPKLTDSPSAKPSEAGGATPKSGGRKRRTAANSNSVPLDETSNASEMESVQSTEDDVAEETNSGNLVIADESPTGGAKNRKSVTKNSNEDSIDEAINDNSPKVVKKVTKKTGPRKKLGLVKTSIVIAKRKAPIGVTGKKANRRRRRHSAGDDTKPKILRNGKPRADSPSAKKKRPRLMSATVPEPLTGIKTLPQQTAKIEAPSSDSEVSRRRRRSDSLSKCSDTTDTSSFCDQILVQKSPNKTIASVENNNDANVDADSKIPDKLKILDKMSQNFNTETAGDTLVIDTAKFVRRSTRQRRSVVTPTPPPIQIKTEPKDDEILPLNALEMPLEEVTVLTDPSPPILNKADSVSPEPAPQDSTQRAMHVKQFYGQPAFMENNVGIESDPNLGEIITQAPVLDKEMPLVSADCASESLKDEVALDTSMDVDESKAYDSNTSIDVETVKVDLSETPVISSQDSMLNSQTVDTESDVDVERLDDVAIGDISLEDTGPSNVSQVSDVKNITLLQSNITVEHQNVLRSSNDATEKMEQADELPMLEPEPKCEEMKIDEVKENLKPNQKIDDVKNSIIKRSDTPPPVLESLICESPETLLHKESVMNALGLLTLQAADAAKRERKKQKEQRLLSQQQKGSGYTGTLKTVIKLNRGGAAGANGSDKRRARCALKMTFQKGSSRSSAGSKHRGTDTSLKDHSGDADGDSMYYTIQNEVMSSSSRGGRHYADSALRESGGEASSSQGSHSGNGSGLGSASTGDGYHNNSSDLHGSFNHNSSSSAGNTSMNTSGSGAGGDATAAALVIPEKASSFSIHPGRLCRDQCHYCGGKFGLFDTPCHVAQIKSLERQKRILEMEEKLTVDNCLCDACYRHVDRRANCPSYRKRLSNSNNGNNTHQTSSFEDNGNQNQDQPVQQQQQEQMKPRCRVVGCCEDGTNTLRRKWLLKMKKNVEKILDLHPESPVNSIPSQPGNIHLCTLHYDAVSHLLVCALCKRRLARNHAHYLAAAESSRAADLLRAQGVPYLGLDAGQGGSSAVCKLCRYYVGLLFKADAEGGRTSKAAFIKSYRRRLLESHNMEIIEDDSDSEDQLIHQFVPGAPTTLANKKAKTAKANVKKTRKSTESTTDIQPENYDFEHPVENQNKTDAEDIENIISKNTIHINRNSDLTTKQMKSQKLNEVPSQKSVLLSNLSNSMHKKNRLDEILSQQQESEQLKAEKVQQLRSNPSLSVRELFPGEDEMGLHANIPLNRGGPRTPEGWTKCTTTIQYDEETKRLWNHLQEPYGNQSSFLRHLILLEKYFRSGDLILSQNATSSATNYSESVQNRLRSFDHIPSTTNSSMPPGYRPNLTVTKKPSDQLVNSSANIPPAELPLNEISQLTKKFKLDKKTMGSMQIGNMVSLAKSSMSFAKPAKKSQETNHNRSPSVPPDLISIGNKTSITAAPITTLKRASLPSTSVDSPIVPSLKMPGPSSSSINTSTSATDATPVYVSASLAMQAVAAVTSVPTTTTFSTSIFAGPSGSSLTVVPVSTSSTSIPSLPAPKEPSTSPVPGTAPASSSAPTPTSTPTPLAAPAEPAKKSSTSVKPWRPTLIPIDPNSEPPNPGQLFQTVDGRRLPSLVQVMSGGKPYHISIQDYNRMCILRRQKVVQMQKSQLLQKIKDAQKSDKNSTDTKNSVAVINKKKVVDIPNKVLEQNSVIPIRGNETTKSKKNTNAAAILKNLPQINKNLTVARTTTTTVGNSAANNTLLLSKSDVSVTSEESYWSWDTLKKQKSTEEDSKSQMETMLSKIPKSLTVIPQKAVNRTSSVSPNSVPINTSFLKNQNDKNR